MTAAVAYIVLGLVATALIGLVLAFAYAARHYNSWEDPDE